MIERVEALGESARQHPYPSTLLRIAAQLSTHLVMPRERVDLDLAGSRVGDAVHAAHGVLGACKDCTALDLALAADGAKPEL